MSNPDGWRALQSPRRASGTGFVTSPFTRLARVHALSAGGDTLVALALAGSLFFSIDPAAARPKVALYLVLTVAPFAVVAPLIGPAIDRMKGGRKLMVLASAIARCLVCALMVGHIDSLLLFPEAFVTMVSAKGYQVAKSALVPTVVADERDLVEANSKLQLISGVVGFAAAAPALLLMWVGGSSLVMAFAAIVFACGAVSAAFLPNARVAPERAGPAEVAELRTTGIVLAASAMALLRAMVGFLMFHIAFFFRADGAPTWWFGFPVALAGLGGVLGAAVAPVARRHWREELMIIQVLAFTSLVAVLAMWGGGRWSASFLAGATALAASFAKLAFDSIVQRDAPDVNQGRTFARFETRFQLGWVAGAFVPVVLTLPAWVGFGVVAVVTGFAAGTYLYGLRYVRTTGQMPPTIREVMTARGWLPRRNVPGDRVPTWLRLRSMVGRATGRDDDAAHQPRMTVDRPRWMGAGRSGPVPDAPPADPRGPVTVGRSPLRGRGRRALGARANVPGAASAGGAAQGDPLLRRSGRATRAAGTLPDPLPPPTAVHLGPPPPPPVLDHAPPPPPPPLVDPTWELHRPTDPTVSDEPLPLDWPEA